MQRVAFRGIAVLVGGLLGGAGVAGEDARAWYNIYPLVSGGNVTVSIEGTNAGIQGWSFGLCHDPDAASILEYQIPQELLTIRGGNPPDFMVNEEAVDPYGRESGMVQAVVLAYKEFLVLPSRPGGFPVLDVKYDIRSETSVSICSGLRGDGEPVGIVLTSLGQSLPVTKQPTAVLSETASSAWYTLSPAVSDSNITVSIESSNAEVQGWSFGLAHDPEAIRVATFDWTPELATVNQGHEPSYYFCEEAAEGPTGAGIVQAVVLNFKAPVALPSRPGGFPVLDVQYDVSSESAVFVCDGLRGSGQPVQSTFTVNSTTYFPAAPASASLVRKPYASKLAYRAEPPESGEVITVKLYAEDLSVEGWSFALCHTAQAAEVVEVATSPQVMTLLGGEAPEFVMNDIVPADPFVAVTQKVILGTLLEPVSRGPFPDGLPVLGIRYDVQQNDSLKFCDGDPSGTIRFEGGVLVDGISYVPSTRVGASLVQGALGTQFIRGDADLNRRVNLTDAVYVLMALFMGGPPIPCLDAADANDVARVDISDPIFILNFLFLGGPRPPAPYPEPGEDLNPYSALGCARGL